MKKSRDQVRRAKLKVRAMIRKENRENDVLEKLSEAFKSYEKRTSKILENVEDKAKRLELRVSELEAADLDYSGKGLEQLREVVMNLDRRHSETRARIRDLWANIRSLEPLVAEDPFVEAKLPVSIEELQAMYGKKLEEQPKFEPIYPEKAHETEEAEADEDLIVGPEAGAARRRRRDDPFDLID